MATDCVHDPRYDRVECCMCGGQVSYCSKCGADLCCGPGAASPAAPEPARSAENDYPLTEAPRYQVAYLLWQINQGYILAEDRAVNPENWMLSDPRLLHEDDARELPGWLDAADVVLNAVASEVVTPTVQTGGS